LITLLTRERSSKSTKMLSVLRNEPGADLDMHLNEGKEWSEDQAVEVALNI
jgi:hypothetical protein